MFCDCRDESGLHSIRDQKGAIWSLWWRPKVDQRKKKAKREEGEKKRKKKNKQNWVRPVKTGRPRRPDRSWPVGCTPWSKASLVRPVMTGRPALSDRSWPVGHASFRFQILKQQGIPVPNFSDPFSGPILMIFENPTHLCRRGARRRTNPSGFVSIGATDW
jgi:hypothetical protein